MDSNSALETNSSVSHQPITSDRWTLTIIRSTNFIRFTSYSRDVRGIKVYSGEKNFIIDFRDYESRVNPLNSIVAPKIASIRAVWALSENYRSQLSFVTRNTHSRSANLTSAKWHASRSDRRDYPIEEVFHFCWMLIPISRDIIAPGMYKSIYASSLRADVSTCRSCASAGADAVVNFFSSRPHRRLAAITRL